MLYNKNIQGGDDLNERLKALRKKIGLTQQEFAERLGLKRNTVATYEIGKATPSDRVLSDICAKFSVNEDWIRSGTGEMFRKPSDEVGYYVEELLEYEGSGNPFYDMIIEMMKTYHGLDEKSQKVIREYFRSVKNGSKKKEEG